MKKHLFFKAMILIIVMFFHSFVLVPKSYADASLLSQVVTNTVYRGIPPSTLIAEITANTQKALLLGWRLSGVLGVGYLLYEHGALTKLADWWNDNYGYSYTFPPVNSGQYSEIMTNADGCQRQLRTSAGGTEWAKWYKSTNGAHGWGSSWTYGGSTTSEANARDFISHGNGSNPDNSPPTTVYDYGLPIGGDPGFSSGELSGTPGSGAILATGPKPEIVSANYIDSGDVEAVKGAMGLTDIDPSSGSQPGGVTDNTVTQGDSNTSSLLGQILGVLISIRDYCLNLIGIKTGIDNVVANTSGTNSRLDNVYSAINAQAGVDNQISLKMDNVILGLNGIDNALKSSSADNNTISSRINNLKTIASTKFPFSLASSLSVSAVSGSATYAFTALPLTPSISIPIEPMLGPLATLFEWIRQLLVWFFWTGTLFAILKKGMEM